MNLELDNNYLEALEVVKKYHKEVLGFTNYEGNSASDKIYSKQNNLEIALLIKICQKLDFINIRLDNLEQKLNKLSFEKEIDKLTELIIILSLGVIVLKLFKNLLRFHSSPALTSESIFIGFINCMPLLAIASIMVFISTLYLVVEVLVHLPIIPMFIIRLSLVQSFISIKHLIFSNKVELSHKSAPINTPVF